MDIYWSGRTWHTEWQVHGILYQLLLPSMASHDSSCLSKIENHSFICLFDARYMSQSYQDISWIEPVLNTGFKVPGSRTQHSASNLTNKKSDLLQRMKSTTLGIWVFFMIFFVCRFFYIFFFKIMQTINM